MNIKKLITSITLILSVLFTSTLSSCLGSFSAFNSLREWNGSVTGNKFVNNLLFWVLLIVPVYSLFLFVDIVILNLIEFWTGSNPIGMKAGESESQLMTYNGKDYIMTATKDKMTLTDTEGNFISELIFDRSTYSWTLNKDGMSREIISIDDINTQNVSVTVNAQNNPQSMQVDVNQLRNPLSFWAMK